MIGYFTAKREKNIDQENALFSHIFDIESVAKTVWLCLNIQTYAVYICANNMFIMHV